MGWKMRVWKKWHQNARVEKSRCDINYINVLADEKHVDIMKF